MEGHRKCISCLYQLVGMKVDKEYISSLVLHLLMIVQKNFLLKLLGTHVAGELGGTLEPRQVPVERLPGEWLRTAGRALQVPGLKPKQILH